MGRRRCCCPCDAIDDAFARSVLGSRYSVLAGTWPMTGGYPTTSDTGALIKSLVPAGSKHQSHWVSLQTSPDLSGSTIRLYADYTDSSSPCFELFVDATTGYFKLTAGVKTDFRRRNTTPFSMVGICIDTDPSGNRRVSGGIVDDLAGVYVLTLPYIEPTSQLGAFGTGDTNVAGVAIAAFKSGKVTEVCEACVEGCGSCQQTYYDITLTGLTDYIYSDPLFGIDICDQYSRLNGSYTATPTSNLCEWHTPSNSVSYYCSGSKTVTVSQFIVRILYDSATDTTKVRLQLTIGSAYSISVINATDTVAGRMACEDLVGQSFSFTSSSGVSQSATITIDAIYS